MILGRSEPAGRVVVPDHKHVRVGTLRKIISQAGLTVEDLRIARSMAPPHRSSG